MAKKLSCCSFVLTPDRGAVPVDSLSAAEKTAWHERLRLRLGTQMGEYYTQHPEALAQAPCT